MGEYIPTEKEVENGRKVLDILSDMEGIGYDIQREDLIVVTEEESGLSITVDAEERVICLIMEVMDLPSTNREGFYQTLLELNDRSLHGTFCLNGGKVFFEENLEAESLDPNELESALASMFLFIAKNIEELDKFNE